MRRLRAVAILACGLLGWAVAPAPAWAAEGDANVHLQSARSQFDRVDLPAARRSLDLALRFGGNNPEQLAEIYELSGIVNASLGSESEAREHFKRLLVLDPGATLPSDLSPKVMEPFERAREWAAEFGRVRVSTQVEPGTRPAVLLVIENDPLQMVVAARARYVTASGSPQVVTARGVGQVRLALPPGPRTELFVSGLDEHGNLVTLEEVTDERVVSDASEAGAAASPEAVVAVETPGRRRPILRRWYVWEGAAAVVLATGVGFGLASSSSASKVDDLNEDSDAHQFSEAAELEDRARSQALVANVAYGVGAALAITGVVMWFTDTEVPPPATVGAVALPGGAAIVYGGDF